jgi:hypothetical protein
MPPNGGIILSQNVHVKPLLSKVKFNASLNIRVLGGSVRSNGLPSGHTDLNGGHPWRGTKYTIRGEGGGFTPNPSCGEFCESKLPMARPSTKSAPTMH